jgi:hypothetical protein
MRNGLLGSSASAECTRSVAPPGASPAMLRCRPMPPPESELRESHERRCPACRSQRVVPVCHVTAAAGIIKSEHRCEACSAAFWFVRRSFT